MSDTQRKDYVTGLLEHYPDDTRKIEALRYEIAHPNAVTSDEMIEAMNFAHGDGAKTGAGSGNISDKTFHIAVEYGDRLEKANAEARETAISALNTLESERERLLHYISLLDERDREMIRATYIERRSRAEISDMLGVSTKSVSNIRRQALEKLCKLYDFTAFYRG